MNFKALKLLSFAAAIFLTSCAFISKGGSTLNDPEPSSPVIASGTIAALNGKAVSGGVAIYGNSGDSTTIVRFAGLTMPNEGPYYFFASTSAGSLSNVSLRAISGTFNQTVSIPGNATWTLLTIRNASNFDYAQVSFH